MQRVPIAVYTRKRDGKMESSIEKTLIVPRKEEEDPAVFLWTEGMFVSDILHEHALFFSKLLSGPDSAKQKERAEAFKKEFAQLHAHVSKAGVPKKVDAFAEKMVEKIEPFIEFKKELEKTQKSGELNSLAWPMYYKHTREEAEQFVKRFNTLKNGRLHLRKSDVGVFWSEIMGEHALFLAHWFDPAEKEWIESSIKQGLHFKKIHDGLDTNPNEKWYTELVRAGNKIAVFKTEAARNVEEATVESHIDPKESEHLRRETLKFLDEWSRIEE